MAKEETRQTVIEALREVQELSGRKWRLPAATEPIVGALEGFDSLSALEASALLEYKLNIKLRVPSVFFSEDGKQALTLEQACNQLESNATATVNTLGDRLRLAREQSGLSQGEVARKLGMHRPTISEIEANRRRVTLEEFSDFARLYGVPLWWLWGEESQTEEKSLDDRALYIAQRLSEIDNNDLDTLLRVFKTFRDSFDKK